MPYRKPRAKFPVRWRRRGNRSVLLAFGFPGPFSLALGRLRLRLAIALALRLRTRRALVALLCVIGHIPARTLELHRRRMNHLLDLILPALRTLRRRRIRKLLNLLEAVTTCLAQ